MKKIKILAGCLAICALFIPSFKSLPTVKCDAIEQVAIQSDETEKCATVFGAGVVTASPDMATISLGVETQNQNLEEAVELNNSTIIAIVEYLTSNGIEEENIKTQNYTIFQKHDYTASPRFLGYQVSSNLEFVTNDLENIGSLITELTSLGANRLNGITFGCQDIKSYYNEALKLAIEDATNKANIILGQGAQLMDVEEQYSYTCVPYSKTEAILSNSKSVMTGKFEIEAKIKASFCL